MAYLKNTTTGEIYPMNEHLALRGDFITVETLDADSPAAEPVAEPTPARAPRKAKAKEQPPEPGPNLALDLGDIDIDLPQD